MQRGGRNGAGREPAGGGLSIRSMEPTHSIVGADSGINFCPSSIYVRKRGRITRYLSPHRLYSLLGEGRRRSS